MFLGFLPPSFYEFDKICHPPAHRLNRKQSQKNDASKKCEESWYIEPGLKILL